MLLFVYWPFVNGIRLGFMDFSFLADSKYIGMANFKKLLDDKEFYIAFRNTVIFGIFNAALGIVLPAAMAVLLNEVKLAKTKRVIQTIIYLPSLFSWVIVGSLFVSILSPTIGAVNLLIKSLGGTPIYFFGEETLARTLFIAMAQWKGVGFGLIIYLAAITGIDPTLYEAAEIDGADRWQRIRHITLPGIKITTKMMMMFGMMGILSLFDQVFVLDNWMIHDKVNVLMTYIYSTGLRQFKFGYAASAAMTVGIVTLMITLVSKKALRFGFESEGGE